VDLSRRTNHQCSNRQRPSRAAQSPGEIHGENERQHAEKRGDVTHRFERSATENRMPNVRRENEEKPKWGKNRVSLLALRRSISFDDVWV